MSTSSQARRSSFPNFSTREQRAALGSENPVSPEPSGEGVPLPAASPPVAKRRKAAGKAVGKLLEFEHSAEQARARAAGSWPGGRADFSLSYGSAKCELEISVAGSGLLRGQWSLELAVDSVPLVPTGAWQLVCWETNETTAFLEISRSFGQGWYVSRQVAFVPADGICLLADAVQREHQPAAGLPAEAVAHASPPHIASLQTPESGSQPPLLAYASEICLAPQVIPAASSENTEVVLSRGKTRAMALPLALPEWRSPARAGSLAASTETPGTLRYSLPGTGDGLYAPLWLDLVSRRARAPYTWRKLTVAEQLCQVPDSAACGFRVQAGKQQWLLYRSLGEPNNRTVLGHNTISDFLLGRFATSGEVTPLIEIE